MLMAWGPFRFTIPTYSVETLQRAVSPRVEAQPIIGAAPSLHRLGPGNETITLESTFHPHHLNGAGLMQLEGVRQAVNALTPLALVHLGGTGPNIFGRWVATDISDEQTMMSVMGTPQTVTTTLQLTRYDTTPGRSIAIAAAIGSVFSGNMRLGF